MHFQIIPGATYIVIMPGQAAPIDEDGVPNHEAEQHITDWINVVESYGAKIDRVDYVDGATTVQFIELLQPMPGLEGMTAAMEPEDSGTVGTPTATDAARERWKANDKPRPMTRSRDQE